MLTIDPDVPARCILAACREVDANPFHVCNGYNHTEETRARMYAAMALRRIYPGCPTPAIGRMVGTQHAPYLGIIQSKIARGQFRWWDGEVLERVVAAAGVTPGPAPRTEPQPPARRAERPSAPEIIPSFLPREAEHRNTRSEFSRFGPKRRLEEELQAAVRNTQAMTPPPEESDE